MPTLLFITEDERQIAKELLKTYGGQMINPNENPIIHYVGKDGKERTNGVGTGRQPKGFSWLLKKLVIFKYLCCYELLTKIRNADQEYFDAIDLAESIVGPKGMSPKDVVAGASSCRSTFSEQEAYLNKKQVAEENHRKAMASLNYYFKIAEFVSDLQDLMITINPDCKEMVDKLYGSKNFLMSHYTTSDNPIEKSNLHKFDYDKRKCDKKIRLVNLTESEIDDLLSFERPQSHPSKYVKEVYGYYFLKARSASSKMAFNYRLYNAALWDNIEKTGKKGIAAFDVDEVNHLRLPVTGKRIFQKYY